MLLSVFTIREAIVKLLLFFLIVYSWLIISIIISLYIISKYTKMDLTYLRNKCFWKSFLLTGYFSYIFAALSIGVINGAFNKDASPFKILVILVFSPPSLELLIGLIVSFLISLIMNYFVTLNGLNLTHKKRIISSAIVSVLTVPIGFFVSFSWQRMILKWNKLIKQIAGRVFCFAGAETGITTSTACARKRAILIITMIPLTTW